MKKVHQIDRQVLVNPHLQNHQNKRNLRKSKIKIIIYRSKAKSKKSNIISPQPHNLNSSQHEDPDQMTGRFRDHNYDDRHMYASPYPHYPPVYTTPVFPVSGNIYGTSYPAQLTHTPQFVVNEHTFSKTDQQFYRQGGQQLIDEAVEKKLQFDVGTSPENPEVEIQTDPEYAEMFSDKEVQPEYESKKYPEQPSYVPSPSKYEDQNKSNSMNVDAVTRGWIEALQFLDSEDYQSAYETVLSTGNTSLIFL